MRIIQAVKENLSQLTEFVMDTNQECLCLVQENNANSTIGMHIRHTLEFYLILVNQAETGKVNYDLRIRDVQLETNIDAMVRAIAYIDSRISEMTSDRELIVLANYSTEELSPIEHKSSLNRELAYCLEHAIHHFAIIKLLLCSMDKVDSLNPNFGVAYSTIRNQQQCAQ